MSQITLDVKTLLEDLSLYNLPVDPQQVCRKLSIDYDEKPYEGFDGTLIVSGENQLIGVNSSIVESGRKAFTCAHELGHAFYDVDSQNKSFSCTRDDLGLGKANNVQIEIRANAFASELLLPKDLFLNEIKNQQPSWNNLKNLSTKLGTSLQATSSRFVALSYYSCWLVVVKNGVIQRFTKAPHNDFVPQVKKTFKPPKIDPGQFQETSADFWFYPNKNTRNKKIKFWSLPENRYGECPILLWDSTNCLLNDFESDNFDDDRYRHDDDNGRSRW